MHYQDIHGYVLHQRAYREKSKTIQFLSLEFGIVDVIHKNSLPVFQSIQGQISGKGQLKTLSNVNLVSINHPLAHQGLISALYVNELLIKLMPKADVNLQLFENYIATINALKKYELNQQSNSDGLHRSLSCILRQFELTLFDALGFAIHFEQDSQGNLLQSHKKYHYIQHVGFVEAAKQQFANKAFTGESLLLCHNAKQLVHMDMLPVLNALCKQVINDLLMGKPLYTRQLWLNTLK